MIIVVKVKNHFLLKIRHIKTIQIENTQKAY